jgi:glycosyltransferase involved in cell wall biosynthesis
MNKRRVLLMAVQLGIGGSERQLTEIAKTLDRNQFEPYVACFESHGIRGDELRAAGVPIVEFGVNSFLKPKALLEGLRLSRFIRTQKIDIVHSFDVPMNVFAIPFAKFASTPVVISSQRAHRDLSSRPYRQLLRLGDQLVDGIVVNCLDIQRHLMQDEGIPRDRIHLCYNGINLDRFRAGSTHNEVPVIGVVCNLREEKDLPALLRAFQKVAYSRPARLRIVGSGPVEDGLKALAAQLQLGEKAEFIPTQQDVSGYLRSIDFFVLPSRSEALSNALMEAMACGCACIASNVGGNPELVGEGRGMLFESGNDEELARCLMKLMDEPALAQQMREAATRFVSSHFTIAASSHRMMEIYRSFLN